MLSFGVFYWMWNTHTQTDFFYKYRWMNILIFYQKKVLFTIYLICSIILHPWKILLVMEQCFCIWQHYLSENAPRTWLRVNSNSKGLYDVFHDYIAFQAICFWWQIVSSYLQNYENTLCRSNSDCDGFIDGKEVSIKSNVYQKTL